MYGDKHQRSVVHRLLGQQAGQPRSRDRRPLNHSQKSGVVVGKQRNHRRLVRRNGRTGKIICLEQYQYNLHVGHLR